VSHIRFRSLCLPIALGLLTLAASEAQATPNWMTPPQSEPLPGHPIEASGKVEKELVLLTQKGGTKVEVLCTVAKFVDGLLEVSGGASGKAHFEGCITKLNDNGPLGACKPHSPGAAKGLIETNALDGSIQLHETEAKAKVGRLKLSPHEGSTFVTLVFGDEGEEECSIGEKFNVTGTFLVQDGNGEFEVEADTHLFEAGSLSALQFGGNAATLDGSVRVDLPEAGLWSGLGL